MERIGGYLCSKATRCHLLLLDHGSQTEKALLSKDARNLKLKKKTPGENLSPHPLSSIAPMAEYVDTLLLYMILFYNEQQNKLPLRNNILLKLTFSQVPNEKFI